MVRYNSYRCGDPKSLDIHHIVVAASTNSALKPFLLCFSALLIFAVNAFYLFFLKVETSISIFIIVNAILFKLLIRNHPIKKESLVVMPAFGVQLETHYLGGKVSRRFIPVDKILKPVLLECVTPFTCYWNLSLILRGEAEMTSVFMGLRPPAKMLVPIWKALCAATATDNQEESSNAIEEDGPWS